MKSISSKELQQLIHTQTDFQLIDVREQEEHDEFNIGGQLIPLREIIQQLQQIEKENRSLFIAAKASAAR